MKNIIAFLILSTSLCAYSQKCSKYLERDKKQNKESVFDNEKQPVISKWVFIYYGAQRDLSVKFREREDSTVMVFNTSSKNFKQTLKLSEDITIALIFDNDSIYKIKFKTPITDQGEYLNKDFNSNNYIVTPELSKLLSEQTLKSIQIKGGLPNGKNNQKVFIYDAKSTDRLKQTYNCFTSSIE